jgi:SAM-dependent methyltransferase
MPRRILKAMLSRLPPATESAVRRAAGMPQDVLRAILTPRDPLLPPPRLWDVGRGEFHTVGAAFLRLFQEDGGLKPGDRVLDIGCGIGRMAVPLTGFLSDSSSYAGFDVTRTGIRWCRRNISRRFPRFDFIFVDVANAHYNPLGSIRGSEFEFPYPDASFDFVFAVSIFTHLVPDSAQRYLSETRRVLAPSGRFFLTLFLLDERAHDEIASNKTCYNFGAAIPGAFVDDSAAPEAAIAYDGATFLKMLVAAGLRPIYRKRGMWCGGDPSTWQDVLVCEIEALEIEAPRSDLGIAVATSD